MTLEIFATVFVGSLLGSLHCVGMCGGFAAFYAGTDGGSAKRGAKGLGVPHAAYALGRGLVYTALGAVAGLVGAAVNLAGDTSGLSEVAALVAGSLIIGWGLVLLVQATGKVRLPTPRWLDGLLSKILPRLMKTSPTQRALVLGISSALLPCGWLYGFAVTAAGTGRPDLGAFVMFAFWLGTVPAMLGVGLGVQRLAKLVGPRLPLVMPMLLLVLGVATLMNRGVVVPHVHGSAPQASLQVEGAR